MPSPASFPVPGAVRPEPSERPQEPSDTVAAKAEVSEPAAQQDSRWLEALACVNPASSRKSINVSHEFFCAPRYTKTNV